MKTKIVPASELDPAKGLRAEDYMLTAIQRLDKLLDERLEDADIKGVRSCAEYAAQYCFDVAKNMRNLNTHAHRKWLERIGRILYAAADRLGKEGK